MHTYDVDLFLKLAEVFPAALNTSRAYDKIEYRPGPFGMEEVNVGTGVENLGENILNTANSTMVKYGKERALAYIEEYRPTRVQRAELYNFNRRH
jgi:hypothetical protein